MLDSELTRLLKSSLELARKEGCVPPEASRAAERYLELLNSLRA
jgi:hypothetical protein